MSRARAASAALLALGGSACATAARAPAVSAGPPAPAAAPRGHAAATVPSSPPARPQGPCSAPEYRELDFWIGDWDLTIRARSSPTSDQWGEASGHQRVEAILGGCAIAEHFQADGPQMPWAGASYSSWQPRLSEWRQTWVDDSGGYLVFHGGLEHGEMTLYGEPRELAGKRFQMRMVFRQVTADALRWEWQRSDDGWATAAPMITIDYRRATPR